MHCYCVKMYICSNWQVSPMLVSLLSVVKNEERESTSDSASPAIRICLFCFSSCYLCYRYFIHWHFYRPLYRLHWLSPGPGCWKKLKIKSGRLRPSGQINIHGDFCKGFFCCCCCCWFPWLCFLYVRLIIFRFFSSFLVSFHLRGTVVCVV